MKADELIRLYQSGERDFSMPDLHEASLHRADLSGAEVTDEQLAQTKSLKGATLPDGTKHG